LPSNLQPSKPDTHKTEKKNQKENRKTKRKKKKKNTEQHKAQKKNNTNKTNHPIDALRHERALQKIASRRLTVPEVLAPAA